MKTNNILFVVFISLLLVGCGASSFTKTEPVKIITATSYPSVPNIEPLPPVALIKWNHDMPRDLSVLSVISSTECRKVETKINEDKPYVVEPVEPQTDEWWAECGENPIYPESNIHVGFDLDNWNIILENMFKLKERNWQYRQRLEEVNKQRKEWRDKAEQERIKTD